jgi:hypothetical protein
MTNNPTIDGVSRELLADLVKLASRNVRSAWGGGVCEEARALLDTPPNDLREHCKQCAEVVKTWPEWKQSCPGGAPAAERQDHLSFDPVLISAGPDGVSNLERLQATCDGLDSQNDSLADEVAALQSTITQLQARVAELESARGEPVAEVIATGGPHDGEDRVLCELQAELPPIGTKLYAAPPAPVAHTMKSIMSAVCAITGFPMLTSNQCHALARSLNACLDDTVALNKDN